MIRDLCLGLAGEYEPAVVCLTEQCGFRPDGVEIIPLHLAAEGFSLQGMLKLARLVGERRAQVIHSHGRGAAAYAAGARLLHRRSRLVHTVHRGDGDLLSGQAVVRGSTLKAMDGVVAVSQAAADAFAVTNGLDVERICVVHNGVDVTGVESAPHARGGGTLCSIANLSPDKDPETVLEAFSIVRRQRTNARLVMVGDGPRRGEVESMIDRMELVGAVDVFGFREDIAAILAVADVFVHATHTEGLGIAVLEAMAGGVPAVATAVGGLPEIVEDGVTGLLVEPGNAPAMAEAVLRVLDDETLRGSLTANAVDRVARDFSLEAMCERYARLYRDVLAQRKREG